MVPSSAAHSKQLLYPRYNIAMAFYTMGNPLPPMHRHIPGGLLLCPNLPVAGEHDDAGPGNALCAIPHCCGCLQHPR